MPPRLQGAQCIDIQILSLGGFVAGKQHFGVESTFKIINP